MGDYNEHWQADSYIEEQEFENLMDTIRHSAKWLSDHALVWATDEMIKK